MELDNKALLALVEADPRLTTLELGEILGSSYVTVTNHLHQLGKMCKLGVWVPHELSNAKK